MNKTKIDWCEMSWNPVTGCLHGCQYCYARKIAHRFGISQKHGDKTNILQNPVLIDNAPGGDFDMPKFILDPYPFDFAPTFHRYRLNEPETKTKPRNIFVCSMADLFGDWVPDEWIQEIFEVCGNVAAWHRYLFLTKNPKRIDEAIDNYTCEERGSADSQEFFENFWFGTSITSQDDVSRIKDLAELQEGHRFLSIEPILEPITLNLEKNRCPVCGSSEVYQDNPRTCQGAKPWYCDYCGEWESEDGADLKSDIDWVIVGAETGKRKEKVIPQRTWIENVVAECRAVNVPVFMKSSLSEIWGEPLIQEFPWEV